MEPGNRPPRRYPIKRISSGWVSSCKDFSGVTNEFRTPINSSDNIPIRSIDYQISIPVIYYSNTLYFTVSGVQCRPISLLNTRFGNLSHDELGSESRELVALIQLD